MVGEAAPQLNTDSPIAPSPQQAKRNWFYLVMIMFAIMPGCNRDRPFSCVELSDKGLINLNLNLK